MSLDYYKLVNLFHVVFVSSFFIYIGIYREQIYKPVYTLLIIIGIFILVYHSYKSYIRNSGAWINYLHIFLFAPLILIIGINGTNTSRKYYEMLLMLGMASLGYHLYYIYQ